MPLVSRIPSILVAIRQSGETTFPPETGPVEPASVGRRFGALLIDWLLCTMAAGLIADPVQVPWGPVLLLVLVYGFFIGLFAQTPGMRLTRIRCVSYADGGSIGVLRATLRGALILLAVVMDSQGRGLHDRVAGSIVLPVPPTQSTTNRD